MKIIDLSDGKSNVEIPEAEVTEVGETRTVNTRFGTEARVADIKIKDDTAEITLSLWNDDIEKVQVGTFIKISNGYVNSFRGKVKLNVGQYGTLEVLSNTTNPYVTPLTLPKFVKYAYTEVELLNPSDCYGNTIFPQFNLHTGNPITTDEDLRSFLNETSGADWDHPRLPVEEKGEVFGYEYPPCILSTEKMQGYTYGNHYMLNLKINDQYQRKAHSAEDPAPFIFDFTQPACKNSNGISIIEQSEKYKNIRQHQHSSSLQNTKINPDMFSKVDDFISLGYYFKYSKNTHLNDTLSNLILDNKKKVYLANHKIALAMAANIMAYFRSNLSQPFSSMFIPSDWDWDEGDLPVNTLIIPIPDDDPDKCAPSIASTFHSILTKHKLWTNIYEAKWENPVKLTSSTETTEHGITTQIRPDTNIDWSRTDIDQEDIEQIKHQLQAEISIRKANDDIGYNDQLLSKIKTPPSVKYKENYQSRLDRLNNNDPKKICKPLTPKEQEKMENTNIILIDDVVTQGGTISYYADLIRKEYKPKNIYVYCAAVTYTG